MRILDNDTGQSLAWYFNDKELDQNKGFYDEDIKCCFGAHLAYFLADGNTYQMGAVALAKKMNCTVRQLEIMIVNTGAVGDFQHSPFSGWAEWILPPEEVIRKLMLVEELPEDDGFPSILQWNDESSQLPDEYEYQGD